MPKPRILVTGATGKTGTQVSLQVLGKGWPVRAAVHKVDARSEKLKAAGAEVQVVDLYDYDQVLAAMDGITRAYFCPPVQPFMIQAATVFAVAARASKLEFIAQLSQWIASPAHPSMHTRQLWLVEKMFAMIPGVQHTVINPGVFAEPLIRGFISGAANLGVYPNPAGDMRNPSPSNEDIARVVVAVLEDPATHAGKRYRPTASESFSAVDIAASLSKVLKRKVGVRVLPPKMFLKAGPATDVSGFEITNVRYYFEDGKRGTFGINGPTQGIRELTGRDSESLETIVRRFAALPAAKRSFGTVLKEVGTMMKIMLTPAFNVDKFDKQQGYPMPPKPQLAWDSAIWHVEHDNQPGPVSAARLSAVAADGR